MGGAITRSVASVDFVCWPIKRHYHVSGVIGDVVSCMSGAKCKINTFPSDFIGDAVSLATSVY